MNLFNTYVVSVEMDLFAFLHVLLDFAKRLQLARLLVHR